MQHGVAHRDIKSENILINPDSLQIKLIDYGLATIDADLNEETLDNQFLGTPIYMAPDLLKEFGVHRVIASELWCCGVVFWEMLLGEQPYKDLESKSSLLRRQKKPKDLAQFDVSSQVILKGLLEVDEDHRSTLKGCIRFIKEVKAATSPLKVKGSSSKSTRPRHSSRSKSMDFGSFGSMSSSSSSSSMASITSTENN